MRWIRDGGLPLSPPLPLPLFLPGAWCSLIFTSVKERPRRLSALIDSDTWGSVLRLRIRERRASWNVEGEKTRVGKTMERGQSGGMGRQGQNRRNKAKGCRKKMTNLFYRRLKHQEKGKNDNTGSRWKVKSKRSDDKKVCVQGLGWQTKVRQIKFVAKGAGWGKDKSQKRRMIMYFCTSGKQEGGLGGQWKRWRERK